MKSRAELKKMLAREGIRAKKGHGQNFLLNQNMLRWIVEQAGVGPEDVVLEIGTGTGLLAAHLAERAELVLTVEIDHGLARLAGEQLAAHRNILLLQKDVLASKTRLDPEVVQNVLQALHNLNRDRVKVVANLPFSIASPLIVALLDSPVPIEVMIVTIQKEVAERLVACPGKKDYGPLSVAVQVNAQTEILRSISRQFFWPQPEVTSTVVRIEPRYDLRDRIVNYDLFRAVVRALFTARRKRIQRALRGKMLGRLSAEEATTALDIAGIDPARRPDQTSPEEYIALANALSQMGCKIG